MEFNLYSVTDPALQATMRAIAIHELFHILQYNYVETTNGAGDKDWFKIDNLVGHGIYYYVPRLLKHFQAHEICELIVPRPHLSLNGRQDLLTPPTGVERILNHLLPLYKQ